MAEIVIKGDEIELLRYLILNAHNSLRVRILKGRDKEVVEFADNLLLQINKIRREQDGKSK
jgi:metal-responsive CopG/Arc/MetJ family transcriptional regulator